MAGPDLYLIPLAGAELSVIKLAEQLRSLHAGPIEVDVSERRLKQQMRRADRIAAKAALVIGEEELASGRGRLRNLAISADLEVELNAAALVSALQTLEGVEEPKT